MTKEERLAIYQRALEYYKKHSIGFVQGLCTVIADLVINDVRMEFHFPELYAQKPSNNVTGTWYWWPRGDYGKAMRIQALENAIALCQQ